MGFNLNIPAKLFVVNNFCILWPTLINGTLTMLGIDLAVQNLNTNSARAAMTFAPPSSRATPPKASAASDHLVSNPCR